MNFELSEEQQQIKYSIREFAESEIKPNVMEWDESQHFPEELRPKLAELGLMGILFPEEYGGAAMGYVEYATIIEELGRVCGSVGLSWLPIIRCAPITFIRSAARSRKRNISRLLQAENLLEHGA